MNQFPFEIPPTTLAFLVLITTPTFGLWAIKNFADGWPWFDQLKAHWKSLAVLVILVALTVAGTLAQASILNRPVNDQELLYRNLIMALVGWLTSSWYAEAKSVYYSVKRYVYWRFAVKVVPVTTATAVMPTVFTTNQPPLSANRTAVG